jgi:hypothetical protein
VADIVISYKREEQETARTLADALRAQGWSVWWDPKLRAGEHFDDAIEQAIRDAKCVIVLWSKLSTKSEYVKDEASFAKKLGKLLPVAIDNAELPFRFQGLHTMQMPDWKGSADAPGFRSLVEQLQSRIGFGASAAATAVSPASSATAASTAAQLKEAPAWDRYSIADTILKRRSTARLSPPSNAEWTRNRCCTYMLTSKKSVPRLTCDLRPSDGTYWA